MLNMSSTTYALSTVLYPRLCYHSLPMRTLHSALSSHPTVSVSRMYADIMRFLGEWTSRQEGKAQLAFRVGRRLGIKGEESSSIPASSLHRKSVHRRCPKALKLAVKRNAPSFPPRSPKSQSLSHFKVMPDLPSEEKAYLLLWCVTLATSEHPRE